MPCTHTATIKDVTPSADGCEECLKTGDEWVHLRICRACGHVGCCDSSKNKHATKHYKASGHPIMESYDPHDAWGWCFVDEVMLDFSGHQTPLLKKETAAMNTRPHQPLVIETGHAHDGDAAHHAEVVYTALPPNLESRREQIFPTLTPTEIDRLRRFGVVRKWQAGDFVFEAGKPGPGMLVVLRGIVKVTRKNALTADSPIVEHAVGQFMAEVGQLSGRPSLVDGRAKEDVEGLLIEPASLRALVIAEAELGERIMRALILRRVGLIQTGAGGPVLIGTPGSADMLRLQGFLSRNGHPHSVMDPARDHGADEVMKLNAPRADELPLVVCPDGSVMKCPSEQALAHRLGMYPTLDPAHVYDVVVVGAGPAGLATAVYAASEGLSVLVLDTRVIGGQAGASSRIENYLGFPTGISGQALTGRAFVQAQKFGAQVAVPVTVNQLDCGGTPLALDLNCGSRVKTKTVVIASGARYRHPAIPDLAKFEGRGVYYWASPLEAGLCANEDVVLVGGGNSAGQAVVYLASSAARVHLLIRGGDLNKSMSRYLVDRIASQPNVTLHTDTEIVAIEGGEDGVSGVRWRNRKSGVEEMQPTRRLFLFVGADPNTDWLAGCGVKVNEKGFVCTGVDLDPVEYVRSREDMHVRHPYPLESSVSGVFAIGDVRASSTKRVAAAVGEGAAVVAQVHAWLAAQQRRT